MPKRALITGITGQDGSYLAELLLTKGYEVHGLVRRVAADSLDHRYWRIRHLLGKIHLHCATLENYASILQLISSLKPDDCYHLAAQSYIGYSFEDEFSTFESNFGGTHRSEEHTSELQSHSDLVCRLLLEKKKTKKVL